MFAAATNALYTTLRRRGTTRDLAWAIVACVLAALLLLPAILWLDMRFNLKQATLPSVEILAMLCYIALCGWILPLGVTTSYCLFSLPRSSMTSFRIPRLKRSSPTSETAELHPPRFQPGVPAPFVFSEDMPWGWLEYANGSFHGQRLDLKRAVISLGRDENCDIWLDEDGASRFHAELAWDNGRVCLTDCKSLNGVLLNNRPIHGTVLVKSGDTFEVGSHRFVFTLAHQKEAVPDLSDPLAHHRWRSSTELRLDGPDTAFSTDMLSVPLPFEKSLPAPPKPSGLLSSGQWADMAQLNHSTSPAPSPAGAGMLFIHNGELMGKRIPLDAPVMTVGCGTECDIVINDTSISRQHIRLLRQTDGSHVQDLSHRSATRVNGEALHDLRLLKYGDIISVGNIRLEYTSTQNNRVTPLPPTNTPSPFPRPLNGPTPLKLPSRPKEL